MQFPDRAVYFSRLDGLWDMWRHELIVDSEVDWQATIVVARASGPSKNCDVARTCQNMFQESTDCAVPLPVYDWNGDIENAEQ